MHVEGMSLRLTSSPSNCFLADIKQPTSHGAHMRDRWLSVTSSLGKSGSAADFCCLAGTPQGQLRNSQRSNEMIELMDGLIDALLDWISKLLTGVLWCLKDGWFVYVKVITFFSVCSLICRHIDPYQSLNEPWRASWIPLVKQLLQLLAPDKTHSTSANSIDLLLLIEALHCSFSCSLPPKNLSSLQKIRWFVVLSAFLRFFQPARTWSMGYSIPYILFVYNTSYIHV